MSRTLNCVHCITTDIHLCALSGVTGADFRSVLNRVVSITEEKLQMEETAMSYPHTLTHTHIQIQKHFAGKNGSIRQ